MTRLLDALMHPVSQIVLLIGIVGLSGLFIFKPTTLPTRPVPIQITPIAGGMRLPMSTITVPMASQPPVQPKSQPTLTGAADSTTRQPASTPVVSSPAAPTTPTTVPAARSVLSAIPKLRNGPVCACDGESYSCRELGDQAQACFDYCVARGQGDVHRLDFNQNGVACEE